MKVLITGATGSLGRVLQREAMLAGHSIRALIRDACASPNRHTSELVHADLASGDGVRAAVANRWTSRRWRAGSSAS